MYLWNVKALAQDLKEDKVTEKEKMKYFLVTMLLAIFLNSGSSSDGSTWFKWANYIVTFGLTFGGVIWCYNANQRGGNKDFVIRFICLSIPVYVRMFVPIIVLIIIGVVIDSHIFDSSYVSLAIDCTYYIVYFAWVRKYIIYISNNEITKV